MKWYDYRNGNEKGGGICITLTYLLITKYFINKNSSDKMLAKNHHVSQYNKFIKLRFTIHGSYTNTLPGSKLL